MHPGLPDSPEIQGIDEVLAIGAQVIEALHLRDHIRVRPPADFGAISEQGVGTRRDHARRVGIGRAAVWRVVLEAAIARRVVRRRNDDAVCGVARGSGSVVYDDRA